MSRFTVSVKRHPGRQPDPLRPKWRALLATLVIAGLATIGATTLAAPAAADETAPAEVAADSADSSVPESAIDVDTAQQAATEDAPTTDGAQQTFDAPLTAEAEAVAPQPTLTIISAECTTYGGTGTLHYVLSNTHPVNQKRILVFDSEGGLIAESAHYLGTEFDAEVHGLTVGGTYTIRFDQADPDSDGYQTIDVQTITIEPCPDIGLSVTPLACSTDRNGEGLLTLTGLVAPGIVTFDVEGPAFSVGGSLDEFGETEDIELVGMPPGNYYAYVEWQPLFGEPPPPFPVYDWVGFAIQPCQPDVTVAVTECSAAAGTGSALVTVSNLVAGVEYMVWVTDVGTPDGTPYGEPQIVIGETVIADPAGNAELTFASLPGGREYSVWIDGEWEAIPPWEEPPFLGNGGNFAPLVTVPLSASADFSTQPCPVAPVTPGTTTTTSSTTTLAATGTDGLGGALIAAAALLGLGFAALSASRRRGTRRG